MLWSFATGHAGMTSVHGESARARSPKPRPLRPHRRRSDRGRAGARLGPRRRSRRPLRPPTQLHGQRTALPAPADRRGRRSHGRRRTPSHPQPALRRRRLRAALARKRPRLHRRARAGRLPCGMTRRVGTVLIVLLLAIAAGCDGGDGEVATQPPPGTTSTTTGEAALKDAVRQALRRNDRLSGYVLWRNRVPTWATQTTRGPALVTLRQSAADRRKRGVRIRTLANRLEISSIELDPSYTTATATVRSIQRVRRDTAVASLGSGGQARRAGERGATPARRVRPLRRLEGARPRLSRAALRRPQRRRPARARHERRSGRAEAAPRTRAAHRHASAATRSKTTEPGPVSAPRCGGGQESPGRNRDVGWSRRRPPTWTAPIRIRRSETDSPFAQNPEPLGPGQLLVHPRAGACLPIRTRHARALLHARRARAHRRVDPTALAAAVADRLPLVPGRIRTSPQTDRAHGGRLLVLARPGADGRGAHGHARRRDRHRHGRAERRSSGAPATGPTRWEAPGCPTAPGRRRTVRSCTSTRRVAFPATRDGTPTCSRVAARRVPARRRSSPGGSRFTASGPVDDRGCPSGADDRRRGRRIR